MLEQVIWIIELLEALFDENFWKFVMINIHYDLKDNYNIAWELNEKLNEFQIIWSIYIFISTHNTQINDLNYILSLDNINHIQEILIVIY